MLVALQFGLLQNPNQAVWPEAYRNAETGRMYKPHHEAEQALVFSDTPRFGALLGGEGGGKSVAAICKDLNRLRRGMSGIMVSPDLQHFKKSLWPEFRRWCPRNAVVESERYRLVPTWEPAQPFALHFNSAVPDPADNKKFLVSTLYCGGIDDPGGWEGPNVNFAHFDEARRHDTPAALKVLNGRVRIPGPNGEPPQLYFSTTPRKHWLFEYFGPEKPDGEEDEYLSFKRNSRVVRLLTIDNERAGNLQAGFTDMRGQGLTEAEKRVLLEAEWEDTEDVQRFLTSITWWDGCREELPPIDRHTPLVAAADAAVSGDTFGFVAVSRHPSRKDAVAVRYVKAWEPKGKALDFDAIEDDIVEFCAGHNVTEIGYDPYQLHQMMTGLRNRKIVHTVEVSQQAERLVADKNLLDMVLARQVAHNGQPQLRTHLDNADRKTTDDRKLRIVKRHEKQKIDLAVALSMAVFRLQRTPVRDLAMPVSETRTSPWALGV